MRKVVLAAMMSLDGMFDGPGEDAERIDWVWADDEWLHYSVELLDAAGTLVFGRRTFEGVAAYWPGPTPPGTSSSWAAQTCRPRSSNTG